MADIAPCRKCQKPGLLLEIEDLHGDTFRYYCSTPECWEGPLRTTPTALAEVLNKKPTGGHWNSGLAALRNNGLIQVTGGRLSLAPILVANGGIHA